jgi:predicted GIY-YIG superfamily endonuclease
MVRRIAERGHWTEERIFEVAKRHVYLSDFKRTHPRAYSAAQKRGLLPKLRTFLSGRWRQSEWTLDRCRRAARKYDSRKSFRKGSPAAYRASHRYGWLEAVCSHMSYLHTPNGFWTRSRIVDAANTQFSRSDFIRNFPGAYSAAKRMGLLPSIFAHMKTVGNRYHRAIYSIEFDDGSVYVGLSYDIENRLSAHLKKSAFIRSKAKVCRLKFRQLSDYVSIKTAMRREAEAVRDYQKSGWTVLNRAKTGGLGSSPRKWSKEHCRIVAAEYKTLKSFRLEQPNAYNTALRNKWMTEIGGHLKSLDVRGRWSKTAVFRAAKNYDSKRDFINGAPGAYQKALKRGWLVSACRHMRPLRRPQGHWKKEELIRAISKFRTLESFRKSLPSAYSAAVRRHDFERLTARLKRHKSRNGTWTKAKCMIAARPFLRRSEFSKRCGGAASAARKNGWWDEVCKHMPRSS